MLSRIWRFVSANLRLLLGSTLVTTIVGGVVVVLIVNAITGSSGGNDFTKRPTATVPSPASTATPALLPTTLTPLKLCKDGPELADTDVAAEGERLIQIAAPYPWLKKSDIAKCNGWPPNDDRTFSGGEEVLIPIPLPDVTAEQLPLNVKIGQMLMTGFLPDGPALEPLVNVYHVGNFLLTPNSSLVPAEMQGLIEGQLQAWATNGNEGIFALIAIDQGGGRRFSRLSATLGYTAFGDARVLGCINDLELTRKVGRVFGEEMLAVGINMNLAPVLDVNDNPANPVIGHRAFGTDATRVTAHGIAFIEGLQSVAVAAAAKHYPGHGNTLEDSHDVVPVVNKSGEELYAVELAPFRAAVDETVAAIMTAHVQYTNLDEENAATLSAVIVTEILRNKDEMGFGFEGVVMTDSLEQGELASALYRDQTGFDGVELTSSQLDEGYGMAAVAAVRAGVDLIAFGRADLVEPIHTALMLAVETEDISLERIDQAVDRILTMKRRFRIDQQVFDPDVVNSSEHREVLRDFELAAARPEVVACLSLP